MSSVNELLRKYVARPATKRPPTIGARVSHSCRQIAERIIEEAAVELDREIVLHTIRESASERRSAEERWYQLKIKLHQEVFACFVPAEYAEEWSFELVGAQHPGVLTPEPEREAATLGYLAAGIIRRVTAQGAVQPWVVGVAECSGQDIVASSVLELGISVSGKKLLVLVALGQRHYELLRAYLDPASFKLPRALAEMPLQFSVAVTTEFPSVSALAALDPETRTTRIANQSFADASGKLLFQHGNSSSFCSEIRVTEQAGELACVIEKSGV